MASNNLYADRLRSIKKEILVALIVAIIDDIGLIIWINETVVVIKIFLILPILSYIEATLKGFDLGFFPLIFILLFFIFFTIPTILVFLTICQMYIAANRADVNKLKQLNSISWAIMALIFSGIIPAVMLLIARSSIKQLSIKPINSNEYG